MARWRLHLRQERGGDFDRHPRVQCCPTGYARSRLFIDPVARLRLVTLIRTASVTPCGLATETSEGRHKAFCATTTSVPSL